MNTISNNSIKRPIASTLREMQVGQNEDFPVTQITTVRNAITNLQILNRNLKFSTKVNENLFTVTRIS